MKCREKDKIKMYKIYLKCKKHSWPTRSYSDFILNMKKFDSIIDMCETSTYKVMNYLNKSDFKKVEKYYNKWLSLQEIKRKTGISVYKIQKYFIPEKELENLF